MFRALIVGLGNPGREYARTRHNVGEEAVGILAARLGETLKAGKDRAMVAETRLGEHRVVLAFPTTYMNESGLAVGMLMRRHKIDDIQHLIVVHDELDLQPGVVRVKVGGGLEATQRELAKFSARDAEQLPRYWAMLERVADVLRALVLETPPNAGGGLVEIVRGALSEIEALFRKNTKDVVAALDTLTPEAVELDFDTSLGWSMSMKFLMQLPGMHAMAHASQIDYLQTFWDDQEVH